MRLYEFIENLSEEEIENFLDKLDSYRDGLRFNYDLIKEQLGYQKVFDKPCLIDMVNISKSSIMDGYRGFIYNADIESFYEKNAEHFNQYILEYMADQGLNSFDEFIPIISDGMDIDWFLQDITLNDSKYIKRNIARFFASEVVYDVMEFFNDFFDEKLKNIE